MNKILNIYVDTNVLANYFTGQTADIDCLRYIFSKRKKAHLFTSSLALVQVAQILQSNKGKKRQKFSVEQVKNCFSQIISKFNILDLTLADINKSFDNEILGNDVEDRVQYVESQKFNCSAIITNDVSHYNSFVGIRVFSPVDIPLMKRHIGK